jgi:hypothetical protein
VRPGNHLGVYCIHVFLILSIQPSSCLSFFSCAFLGFYYEVNFWVHYDPNPNHTWPFSANCLVSSRHPPPPQHSSSPRTRLDHRQLLLWHWQSCFCSTHDSTSYTLPLWVDWNYTSTSTLVWRLTVSTHSSYCSASHLEAQLPLWH